MLRDAQTHVLPADALDRERIAVGLGYPDWEVLRAALAEQQQRVSTEFAALLAPRKGQAAPDALANYWRSLPDGSNAPLLAGAAAGAGRCWGAGRCAGARCCCGRDGASS
ncbi:hypothetical protein G6F68_015754 [Rhizopus microsporus]|nr:hypothetical protein G6F68_015754 [Rhizopus microsporus]